MAAMTSSRDYYELYREMSGRRLVYWSAVTCLLLLHSPAQAFVETPKFSQLRLLYPGYRHHGGRYTTDDVMTLVLGSNTTSQHRAALVHGGSAAIRLSWTLNRYGGRHAIGATPVRLSRHGDADSFGGADGQQYIFRNEAFGPFLAARYGDPVLERLTTADDEGRRRGGRRRWWRRAVAGKQGMVRVVRYVAGREHGHVGLWDCDRFHEGRDWTNDLYVVAVEFWESADSYCAPAMTSPPSKSRMQALEPSVHVIARHNFASPRYLNDESKQRTSSDRRNAEKLWIQ